VAKTCLDCVGDLFRIAVTESAIVDEPAWQVRRFSPSTHCLTEGDDADPCAPLSMSEQRPVPYCCLSDVRRYTDGWQIRDPIPTCFALPHDALGKDAYDRGAGNDPDGAPIDRSSLRLFSIPSLADPQRQTCAKPHSD